MVINIPEQTRTKMGNTIELVSLSDRVEQGCPLVIGVFHGDEPQGKCLINKYIEYKLTSLSSLLFIPCLNPDGMQMGTRTNANGVDLNRNYPTKNWGQDTSGAGTNPTDYYSGTSPASEIETKFVLDIINKYKPSTILTLHAPYKIVNYDGPAKEIAQKISNIIKYPVAESIGYPTPGSFGTYCGVERNIPTITLELDEEMPIEKFIQPVFKIFDEVL